jgi:hypothetical protein
MEDGHTMSAAEALKAARAAGIHIKVVGEGLSLEALAPPPAAVIEALRRHQAEVVVLLRRRPHDVGEARAKNQQNVPPGPFAEDYANLLANCPDDVPEDSWHRAIEDSRTFLAQWGNQADALGWTADDLFGLHVPTTKPHPSYRRLSRYDCTGLIWLLQGLPVVALKADTAAIENPTGSITVYRRNNKPGLGPLGDSLDDNGPVHEGSSCEPARPQG